MSISMLLFDCFVFLFVLLLMVYSPLGGEWQQEWVVINTQSVSIITHYYSAAQQHHLVVIHGSTDLVLMVTGLRTSSSWVYFLRQSSCAIQAIFPICIHLVSLNNALSHMEFNSLAKKILYSLMGYAPASLLFFWRSYLRSRNGIKPQIESS